MRARNTRPPEHTFEEAGWRGRRQICLALEEDTPRYLSLSISAAVKQVMELRLQVLAIQPNEGPLTHQKIKQT